MIKWVLYVSYALFLLFLVLEMFWSREERRPGWWTRWHHALGAALASAVATLSLAVTVGFMPSILIGGWISGAVVTFVNFLDCRRALRRQEIDEILVTPAGADLVFTGQMRRFRQVAALSFLGHWVGSAVRFPVGGLDDFLEACTLLLFYSLPVIGVLSPAGGFIALRRIDPLGVWRRLWKVYGAFVGAIGLLLAAVALSAAIIAILQ